MVSAKAFGTLADEKAAYTAWGWRWTASQEPSGPPRPASSYVIGPGQDVHGDFEADDVWQNLLMFKRTGLAAYRAMAAQWATYYMTAYETDLDSGGNPDSAYGYDHLFGFGLVDWFDETGDPRALATAIRLGELSLAHYRSSISLRKSGRHLLLVTRLWEKTHDARWRAHMQRIRDELFNPTYWPIASRQPNAYDPVRKIWMIDRAEPGLHVTANAVNLAWVNWGLARYYAATGQTDIRVRDQLIAMARFVQKDGLNPVDGQSGAYIAYDTGAPVYFPNSHVYTTYWIDMLLRGYRLTQDRALLERAKLHWQHGTDAPSGRVGRFVNARWLADSAFYAGNGELSYCSLLFADGGGTGGGGGGGTPPPPPPDATQRLDVAPISAAPGTSVTVTVTNDVVNPARQDPTRDWVGLYLVGAAHADYLAWMYLNGSTTVAPPQALASAMLAFTLPMSPGNYEFRMIRYNSANLLDPLATSPTVVVGQSSPPPPPPGATQLTVSATSADPGASVSVTVVDDIAHPSRPYPSRDWVGLYAVSAPITDPNPLAWSYLNGTQTPPVSPMTSAVLPFTLPTTPGQYEFRIVPYNSANIIAVMAVSPTITVGSVPPPPPPPPPQPPSGGIVLADNTWKALTPGASQRYIPRQATPSNVLEDVPEPTGRSYSGLFTFPGKMLYFGGAHGSYPGNDVELYDIAANVWTQQYKPEVCDINDPVCNDIYLGATSAITPLGRPYADHVYQHMAYDPVLQKFVVQLVGGRTWLYDPATKQWTILGTFETNSYANFQVLAYDQDLAGVLLLQSGGPARGLHIFRNNGWEMVGPHPADPGGRPYSAYMPDRHQHLVQLTQTWLFHSQTQTWTVVAPSPVEINHFEYDTRNHVVIGLGVPGRTQPQQPITLWRYDPVADQWSSLPVGSPSPPPDWESGGQQLLRYDPGANLFVFLSATAGGGNTGGYSQTWGYRYKN